MGIAYVLYRFSRDLHRLRVPLVPWLIFRFIRIAFGTVLPYTASIGSNTILNWSGLGTVIHDHTVIGENCVIGHDVTIGGRSRGHRPPTLGNRVFVGVGAKILGPIKIGDNATIGANAVVMEDVPANAVVAGIPARIIRFKST
ncbi:MAG TPA: DapH/DapD/GlmU-related protein [Terriglobia bacterium]|nr:DapH/DapD/GlmU-related protein [Terriglobia bacterium]